MNAIRLAIPADTAQLVELIRSAYRGEASRQGWTSEVDLVAGDRIGTEEVLAIINGPGSVMIVADGGAEGVNRGIEGGGHVTGPTDHGFGAAGQGFDAAGRGGERAGRGFQYAGRGFEGAGRGFEGAGRGFEGAGRGFEGAGGAGGTGRGAGAADWAGAGVNGVVGCCQVADRGGGLAYFGTFAVEPALQGTGLGRRLMAEAQRVAGARFGATVLEMTVLAQQEALIAWYERLGFSRTGERRPFPVDRRLARPLREGLHFVVLARSVG